MYGKKLRALREQKGLTLNQLSDLCGVDPGTISAIELRDSSRSKYLVPIAKALGTTLEELSGTTQYDKTPINTEHKVEKPHAEYKTGNTVDIKTARLLNYWGQLDDRGKDEMLSGLELFVATRRPHTHGQAVSVAAKK